MELEQETDEKQICQGCGNDAFWVFKASESPEITMFCIYCGDPLD